MKNLKMLKFVFAGVVIFSAFSITTSVPAAPAGKAYSIQSHSMKGDWIYDESSLDRKYASIDSDNGFKFPNSESEYPTPLELELFDFGGNYEFRLTNREAEFDCPVKGACTIQVSFDGGPKKKIEIEYTDGLDARHVNAKRSEYKKLYTALQAAKTMTIDASFAHAGVKKYKFRVGGLKWPAPQ